MAILRYGERLVRAGVITAQQLEAALAEQKRVNLPLGDLVVQMGFASPEKVAQITADLAGCRFEPLSGRQFEPTLATLVTESVARERQLIPIERRGRKLVVALVNPLDIVSVDLLRQESGLDIEVVASSLRAIQQAQDQLYGKRSVALEWEQTIHAAQRAVRDIGGSGDNEMSAVIKLVDELLNEALRRRATDIHIEPEEESVRLRYRVDGAMQAGPSLPSDMRSTITARLKIMADLDISESRLPQDGRIRFDAEGKPIDLRLSTIPTVHGENVVMRVLDKSNVVRGLESIGMAARDLDALKSMLATQSGMVLVTGPTGSGKTTTMYSALAALDAVQHKVATLEDPVEYEMPLIRQSQVHEKAKFGFAEGLRALLRQDPDIIFVGEMRDAETAGIAMRAALTGHLVLSTLHTTSALATLPRLLQLEIGSDLIASALRGVIAQRLVRVVCKHCVALEPPDPQLLHRLGLTFDPNLRLARGRGCNDCSQTGYRGRVGIYEVVRVTLDLADAFAAQAPLTELAAIAARSGTTFLREDGLRKALAGITTLDEVLKATADVPIAIPAESAAHA